MPIVFSCPCGITYTVDDRLAGKQAHCRKCERYLIIPNASGPATEVQPTPQPPSQAGELAEEEVLVAEIVPEEISQSEITPDTSAGEEPMQNYAQPSETPSTELPRDIDGYNAPSDRRLTPLPLAGAPEAIETVVGVPESPPSADDSSFYDIRSVSVWSLAILVAAVGLVSGLIAALVVILAQAISGKAVTPSLFLLTLAGGIGGFILGAVGGIIYNLLASLLGGITVYLSRKDIGG